MSIVPNWLRVSEDHNILPPAFNPMKLVPVRFIDLEPDYPCYYEVTERELMIKAARCGCLLGLEDGKQIVECSKVIPEEFRAWQGILLPGTIFKDREGVRWIAYVYHAESDWRMDFITLTEAVKPKYCLAKPSKFWILYRIFEQLFPRFVKE